MSSPRVMQPTPALSVEPGSAGTSSWRYQPGASSRDLRLDLLRGLCLLKMVLNHLWRTPLHAVHLWTGFVSAAEGFFFISGVVVGIVHGGRSRRDGLAPTARALVQRGGQLYLANLGLVLAFAALEAQRWLPSPAILSQLWERGWLGLLSFDHGYYLQVLPRYAVYLLVAPLALWALAAGRGSLVLLVSLLLWATNLLSHGSVRVPSLEQGTQGFAVASWQLLFFGGMVLGYHRDRAAQWWRRIEGPALALVLALLAGFFVWFHLEQLAGRTGLDSVAARVWMDRDWFAPLRAFNAIVVFALAFAIVDRLWLPLAHILGPLLMPFGRDGLFVYLLHVPMVWGGYVLLRHTSLDLSGASWTPLPLVVATVSLLWLLARYRLLMGLVPR